MNPRAALGQGLVGLGLALDEAARTRLLAYLTLLGKWNKTYNLTAIRDPGQMLTHHLLDSLAVLPHIGPGPLLDVGSGAGLPGIPLAIARPGLELTLLDAVDKKCAFLRQARIELGLDRVTVVHARVEAWRPEQGFAQIISRAFSELNDLVRQTAHLLTEGGRWLAMKGARLETELANLTGARVVDAIPLTVPGLGAERHLIILEPA